MKTINDHINEYNKLLQQIDKLWPLLYDRIEYVVRETESKGELRLLREKVDKMHNSSDKLTLLRLINQKYLSL